MGQNILQKNPYQIGVGTCDIGERAKKYVNEVLESNRLTYGPFSKKFEQLFAEAHGCKYAVFVNSGTSALRIGLAALKEKYGWDDQDEVIIPTITFISDVNIVVHNNLKVVFVDVDPEHYTIDPAKIEEKITARTRAIIPTHLCGLASDMDPIIALAKKHNLRIIEDACEASFARYKGKAVGNFSDIACYSTYQAHIITTGVGGFALTNDPDLAVLLRSLANHGRDGIYMQIDDDKGKSADELREVVNRRFSFIRPGYSFRATELEAALGVAELEEGVEKGIEIRQKNVQLLLETLRPFSDVLQLPVWPLSSYHVFMMFPIVVKAGSGVNRDELVNFLEQYNVETRRLLPILDQPFILKKFGDLSSQFPVGDHLNKNSFYIGCHPSITRENIEYIGKVFSLYLHKS